MGRERQDTQPGRFVTGGQQEVALGRFALINLDEFDSISPTQQAFLKHLLQKPEVKIRQPYGQSVRSRRRYGSFMATCNNPDLLSDPTGSRRFLCIELTGQIDNSRTICYEQLYAQAMEALTRGERHWFTHEEEIAIMQDNRVFQQCPVEEQLFLQYYRKAVSGDTGLWLSATEILLDIQKQSGVHLSKTNMNTFARILTKHQIAKKHTLRGNLWHVLKA